MSEYLLLLICKDAKNSNELIAVALPHLPLKISSS